MKLDFTNKAIKCESWEQIMHLTELAREQGLSVNNMNEDCFPEMDYFCISGCGHFYSHYSDYSFLDKPISYSSFILANTKY